MKILGEKSLSSKVVTGLSILFIIISIADIIALQTTIKIGYHIYMRENIETNIPDMSIFSVLTITGIMALFIIYKFIQIFKKLKDNDLFNKENANKLNTISIACCIISCLYFILAILSFIFSKSYVENIMNYIFAFSIAFAIIFLVASIGIKILNEIYIKAIKYKEENDLVI